MTLLTNNEPSIGSNSWIMSDDKYPNSVFLPTFTTYGTVIPSQLSANYTDLFLTNQPVSVYSGFWDSWKNGFLNFITSKQKNNNSLFYTKVEVSYIGQLQPSLNEDE
jgi:hypothetical protein